MVGTSLARLCPPTNACDEVMGAPHMLYAQTARRAHFRLRRRANHNDAPAPLAAKRGALRDRHERRLRDAMDAACCETNNMTRTAKSCGPGAPRLALSFRRMTRGDGGKKVRSPGRSRISR